MVTALCTTTDGGPVVLCRFPSEEIHQRWWISVNLIKAMAKSIDRTLHDEDRDPVAEDFRRWFALLNIFYAEFGIARVPPDIRTSVNTSEEVLGLPLTVWPVHYGNRPVG